METYQYTQSPALFDRAIKVIPNGIYGHYMPAAYMPGYPLYFSRTEKSRFWDMDGNEFIDYMCAYGPMILGYNHPKIDEAARKQYEKGNTVSIAAPVMVELAEMMVDLIPVADWAFFSKNGADPTNLATMVAKAATGRKKMVMINGGYHGTTPWMQDVGSKGTTPEDSTNILRVDWNDYQQFEDVVEENDGDIAGFISSPYHHPVLEDNALPAEGYWKKMEALCRKKSIVLILDDVRAGFRSDIRGSNEYFGFKPDLICFGKALGNGYPISALVGTEALREAISNVFFTGTLFFSAAPMAAALETLKELKRINAVEVIRSTGKKLMDGMVEIAKGYGYDLRISGVSSMPYLRIITDEEDASPQGEEMSLENRLFKLAESIHGVWISECVKRGAFFLSFHNNFVSAAHTDEDIKRTWDIVDDAFKVVKKKYGA